MRYCLRTTHPRACRYCNCCYLIHRAAPYAVSCRRSMRIYKQASLILHSAHFQPANRQNEHTVVQWPSSQHKSTQVVADGCQHLVSGQDTLLICESVFFWLGFCRLSDVRVCHAHLRTSDIASFDMASAALVYQRQLSGTWQCDCDAIRSIHWHHPSVQNVHAGQQCCRWGTLTSENSIHKGLIILTTQTCPTTSASSADENDELRGDGRSSGWNKFCASSLTS